MRFQTRKRLLCRLLSCKPPLLHACIANSQNSPKAANFPNGISPAYRGNLTMCFCMLRYLKFRYKRYGNIWPKFFEFFTVIALPHPQTNLANTV